MSLKMKHLVSPKTELYISFSEVRNLLLLPFKVIQNAVLLSGCIRGLHF